MSLIINGTTIRPGDRPTFNSVALTQVNCNGTEVWRYDSTAPAIYITSASGYRGVSWYTLTGYIVEADSGIVSVSINNEPITLGAGNTFAKTFNLAGGNNSFTISATDGAGNTGTQTVNVIYAVPEGFTSYINATRVTVNMKDNGLTINYSGDRNSNNCGASIASAVTSYYTDPSGAELASISNTGVKITGAIPEGTRIIRIESIPQTSGTHTFDAKIYDTSGNAITTLNIGDNNVTNYATGAFFYKIEDSVWEVKQGFHGCNITTNVNLIP